MSVASCQLSVKDGKKRSSLATGNRQLATSSTPEAIRRNGLMFDIPKHDKPLPKAKPATAKAKRVRTPRVKRVCDPRLAAAARELRDRWLERVNDGQDVPDVFGKYDVSRPLQAPTPPATAATMRLLEAA